MDYIVIAVILLILGLAIAYIVKAKKSGVKCIGCAMSKTCSGNCHEEPEMPEFIEIGKKTCNHNCSNCSGCKH